MTLEDLLKELALGELSNFSVVDRNDPTQIDEQSLDKVILYVNQGLTALYTKFILSQREVIVKRKSPFTEYYLRPEFAMSNKDSTVPWRYLEDTDHDKFDGNFIKTLQVYDSEGYELYVNDYEQPLSVFTPTFDSLQITDVHQSDRFFVHYQANHNPLTKVDMDKQKVVVPVFLLEALKFYVTAKVLGGMQGEDNTAQSFKNMQLYEAKCSDTESKDLVRTSVTTTNTKLIKRGFV